MEHDAPHSVTDRAVDAHENAQHAGAVGPYRILRELGRGGAGVVFLAERSDDEFHRPVALKLLRYSAWDRRSGESLMQERRALSQLQHPNIAALIDWGFTSEQVPWLAVEYVDGKPIDEYCRDGKLGTAGILELVRQACQAVEYGHRRLIVHCDLKPANILVTGSGLVKLLDFDIARELEQEEAAATEVRCTPDYASPEQIEGKPVTAASDVYALGVLLYELLTGRRPHSSETLRDVARRLEDRPPAAPSAAPGLSGAQRRALKGDLDRIVTHALEADPDRRYLSVEQLLADLERHRCGYPIAGRHSDIVYRSWKFLRRNAWPVAAVSLAAMGLIIGAGVAIAKARMARQQQAAAERRFRELQNLAHSVIFDLHDEIRGMPGTVEARRLLVSTALKYLDGLNAERIQDDALQFELASGYLRMAYVQGGSVSINIGQSGSAGKGYRTALRIFDEQWRRHPDDERIGTLRFATAYNLSLLINDPAAGAALAAPYAEQVDAWIPRNPRAAPMQASGLLHRALGRTLRAMGDLEGARRHLQRSVTVLREMLPKTSHKEWTRPMFSTDIGYGQGLHDTGISTYSLAAVLLDTGRLTEAEAAAQESERLFDLDAAAAPPSPAVMRMLATNHGLKADVLLAMGQLDEAAAEGRAEMVRVRANASRDGASATDQRDLVEACLRTSRIFRARGDLRASLTHLEEALSLSAKMARLDQNFLPNRFLHAAALNDYGNALLRTKGRSAARPVFESALEISGQALLEAPSWVDLLRERARAYTGLGMVERGTADWNEYRRRSPLHRQNGEIPGMPSSGAG